LVTESDLKRETEIADAIRVLADPANREPVDAINELVSRGYSQARSERLYFVLELAFGRAVIEKLGVTTFPETYILDSADGKEIEHHLLGDPHYQIALGAARSMVQEGPRDVLVGISLRSAELAAVNEMLSKGLTLKRLLPSRWSSSLNASEWEVFS